MNYWMAREEWDKKIEDESWLHTYKEETVLINSLKKKIVKESEDKGTEKLRQIHE